MLSSSCASTSASSSPAFDAAPTVVVFTDYRSGTSLTLVNEVHTSRVDFYSSMRSNASTKVATDEVVSALVEFFADQGFTRHAAPGRARGRSTQSLELERAGQRIHMSLSAASGSDEARVFRTCRQGFIELYDQIYQLQSVDKVPGTFEQKRVQVGGR
jgi:hypothetical protein